MWNIKKITILLCFLSLVAFISCSAEDKTGSPKPEGEAEITGGSGERGSGGGGETGGTKTTEETIDFPDWGIYIDDVIWTGWNRYDFDTKVSTVSGKTTIVGYSLNKRTKGTKITKFQAVDIVSEAGYNFSNISIIYDYHTKTLKITFKNDEDDCSFEGKFLKYNM